MLGLVELRGGLVGGGRSRPGDRRPSVGCLRLGVPSLAACLPLPLVHLWRLVPLHHGSELLRRLHSAHLLSPNSLIRLEDVDPALAFSQLPDLRAATSLFHQAALARLLWMKMVEQLRLIILLASYASCPIEEAERGAPRFPIVVGNVGVHAG